MDLDLRPPQPEWRPPRCLEDEEWGKLLEAARLLGVAGEDGRRCNRAVFVIDRGGTLLHQILWHQPGNIGKFVEISQVLDAV